MESSDHGCVGPVTNNFDCNNTFIFNWVDNYDQQVNVLKQAMESLDNKVEIYNHLTEKQLIEVVNKLSHGNFEMFNYVVFVILDNKCHYEDFIQTSDHKNVLLNSQMITKIKTNPTLHEVPRLFVLQKLLDVADMDDRDLEKYTAMKLKKASEGAPVYCGLEITLISNEMTDNFSDSPFLEVFAEKFRSQAKTVDISRICDEVRREIKDERNYQSVDILTGSNRLDEKNLIYGVGISPNWLRDFF